MRRIAPLATSMDAPIALAFAWRRRRRLIGLVVVVVVVLFVSLVCVRVYVILRLI